MAEYKLSYTAKEIDEKLGKVDSLVATVNGIAPDANGNVVVAGGGSAIIDVTDLPTENINECAFYRLMTGCYIYNQNTHEGFTVYCVKTLPEVGLPATNADITQGNVYYCISDNAGYGYVDTMLAMGMGVPAGWYDGATLLGALGYTYGGVITDINDDPCDGAWRLLINKDFYIYQDGWCKLPFAYEKAPAIDIQWDGDMTGKTALDMSLLGFDGTYFVKVSDDVYTTDQIIGCSYENSDGYCNEYIEEYQIDSTAYPGALDINSYVVVVYDDNALASALGIPAGIYTNGVYFWLHTEYGYTKRFASAPRVTKIDSKYLPDADIGSLGLHQIATSGSYYDLSNKPMALCYDAHYSLNSQYQKNVRNTINVYSKSEVDSKIANAGTSVDLSAYSTTTEIETMISNAIGSAIGGSY